MNNVYSGLMEIIVITERVCDAHTKWNGRKLDSELHRRKKEREKFRPHVSVCGAFKKKLGAKLQVSATL